MEWHYCRGNAADAQCVFGGPRFGTHDRGVEEYLGREDELTTFRQLLAKDMPETGKIRTICEVGLNAGHGAAIWLEGTDAKLKSFDMFVSNWSAGAIQLNEALYPGRTQFFGGDSQVTVKAYAKEVEEGRAERCDVWYIDGAHTGKIRARRYSHRSQAPVGANRGEGGGTGLRFCLTLSRLVVSTVSPRSLQ
eukprot:2931361-Prymnesium_polylepis.1